MLYITSVKTMSFYTGAKTRLYFFLPVIASDDLLVKGFHSLTIIYLSAHRERKIK